MPKKSFSVLDLIGLPEEQSRLMLYLVDNGAQSSEKLANILNLSSTELESILKILMENGFIVISSKGLYEANMGKRNTQSSDKKKRNSSFMDGLLDSLIDMDDD